jgi:hypothetical protein
MKLVKTLKKEEIPSGGTYKPGDRLLRRYFYSLKVVPE